MLRLHSLIAAIVTLGLTSSWALVGVGGHWAPNGAGYILGTDRNIDFALHGREISAHFDRPKSEIGDGFGVKIWYDLPWFPLNLEATLNIQSGSYPVELTTVDPYTGEEKQVNVTYNGKQSPTYSVAKTDFSGALRPFHISRELFELMGYVGGGGSLFLGRDVIGPDYFKKKNLGPSRAYGDFSFGWGGACSRRYSGPFVCLCFLRQRQVPLRPFSPPS